MCTVEPCRYRPVGIKLNIQCIGSFIFCGFWVWAQLVLDETRAFSASRQDTWQHAIWCVALHVLFVLAFLHRQNQFHSQTDTSSKKTAWILNERFLTVYYNIYGMYKTDDSGIDVILNIH